MENLVNMKFHFTLNYWFLLRTTDFYSELLIFTPNDWFFSELLIFTQNYWYLPRITDIYSELLTFTQNYYLYIQLVMVVKGYTDAFNIFIW